MGVTVSVLGTCEGFDIESPIGIIGLGLLGSALAQRLLNAGVSVRGYDIAAANITAFEALGGVGLPCAEAVAGDCRVVLLSLPTSAVVRTVIDQVQRELRPGAIIVDTTTGDPADSERMAERMAARNVAYLDATVVGSSQQAREGQAVMLLGGGSNAMAQLHELFSILARRFFVLGASGSGARMKLVVNLVLGLNRAVLAEGLSLAVRCGIEPALALDVLRSGAAFSAVMDSKGEKMIRGDFEPHARLVQHQKDVGLILELAQRVGQPVPLSQLHAQLLLEVVRLGLGDQDNSAIIRAFDARQ